MSRQCAASSSRCQTSVVANHWDDSICICRASVACRWCPMPWAHRHATGQDDVGKMVAANAGPKRHAERGPMTAVHRRAGEENITGPLAVEQIWPIVFVGNTWAQYRHNCSVSRQIFSSTKPSRMYAVG